MNPDLAQKWRHYCDTRDAATRDQLITHYVPLVTYVARRAVANAPAHQDRGEFESFGFFGLIDAVDKFDPHINVNSTAEDYSLVRAFESYAIRRIHGAILDGLRREDPLTRSARKRVKEVEATVEALETQLYRNPTPEEIAAELGAEPAEIRTVLQMVKTMDRGLDMRGGDGDGEISSVEDRLVDVRHDQPELAVEISELQGIVSGRLARLPERERTFAALYYCEQMSLTEIGQILGISESRVGQIRLRLIQQLRGTPLNAR